MLRARRGHTHAHTHTQVCGENGWWDQDRGQIRGLEWDEETEGGSEGLKV